jgi:predicted nuclease with TOPRIM domain
MNNSLLQGSIPVAACSIPITVDEYQELKRTLEESQLRMQQLMNSNTTLADEVASLQNMVYHLPSALR